MLGCPRVEKHAQHVSSDLKLTCIAPNLAFFPKVFKGTKSLCKNAEFTAINLIY